MFTGIDIGGTNTDIAVMNEDCIETVKIPNESGLYLALKQIPPKGRFAVSTSQPLNRIVTESASSLRVITIPGPGLKYEGAVRGAVTTRGDLVEEVDAGEIREVLSQDTGKYLAIAGKFSIRNPVLEEKVREIALEYYEEDHIAVSHQIGEIGFPARIATTSINARIREFESLISAAIRSYAPHGDFLFMKGDGGLTSPGMIMKNPSQLYNSSAAAVVLGARYLTREDRALVIDIGGTTTDFVPMDGGLPIVDFITDKGVRTDIRSVRSLSLPYGGDSSVDETLMPYRAGIPCIFGGTSPTLTDALWRCGYEIGGPDEPSGLPDRERSEKAVTGYLDSVSESIRTFSPERIIVTGYLGPALAGEISKRAGVRVIVPEHAECANAVGVAVSKVSLSLNVRYDSERKRLVVNGDVRNVRIKYSDNELIEDCIDELKRTAGGMGAPVQDCNDAALQKFRVFNVVRNGIRTGKIVDLCVAIPPGITSDAP